MVYWSKDGILELDSRLINLVSSLKVYKGRMRLKKLK